MPVSVTIQSAHANRELALAVIEIISGLFNWRHWLQQVSCRASKTVPRLRQVGLMGVCIAPLLISEKAIAADIYYVGDQSTLKDNNGTGSYHDGLNWLNFHAPGGVISGTGQNDDADGSESPGNGVAYFDSHTDHRPNNPGGIPPVGDEYGLPSYLYFGDFTDRRSFTTDKLVPGGTARPAQVLVASGDYTFDMGSNNGGSIGGLSVDTRLVVGTQGNLATLDVVGGGAVHSIDINVGYLGSQSRGTLNISGTGTELSAFALTVGHDGGIGHVSVTQGAHVSATNAIFGLVGGQGSGVVSGAGSRLEAVSLAVGILGDFGGATGADGKLTIANGGTVTTSGSGRIGENSYSTGIVEVVGSGSKWLNDSWLVIGGGGTGTLRISDGGNVANQGASLQTGSVEIDSSTADESVWSIQGEFSSINGEIHVKNNGRIAQTGGTVFLDGVTTTNTLQIDAGGTWTNNQDLNVGRFGSASFDIGGHASTVGVAVLGTELTGTGSVGVHGDDANWAVSGPVFVGNRGEGELSVTEGASVSSSSGYIAATDTSVGQVTIDGMGSSWTVNHGLYVGGTDGGFGGHASISISNAGSLKVSDRLHLWGDSTLDVSQDGTAIVGSSEGSATEGTLLIAASGIVSGTGTIVGDVIVDGGILAPGASPGVLSINGNLLIENSSRLVMEIGGRTAGIGYDQLKIAGDLQIAGVIQLGFVNGFSPMVGDQFSLFEVGGEFNASLAQVDWLNAPSGLAYDSAFVNGVYTVNITAVPEPSTLVLAGWGTLVAFAFRRRRRMTGGKRGAELNCENA